VDALAVIIPKPLVTNIPQSIDNLHNPISESEKGIKCPRNFQDFSILINFIYKTSLSSSGIEEPTVANQEKLYVGIVVATSIALQQSAKPPNLPLDFVQDNAYLIDVDPFTIIDV